MTEAEWEVSRDPKRLLRTLGGKASRRKLRLFICACWRMSCSVCRDELSLKAVEVAERLSDKKAAESERLAIHGRIMRRGFPVSVRNEKVQARVLSRKMALDATTPSVIRPAMNTMQNVMDLAGELEQEMASGRLSSVFRDIFPNPFRPPPPIPASVLQWNQGLVRRLAEEAYQQRQLPSGHMDPERLAVLADALEEAGADAQLVEHLRGPGQHTRGCHVVDLLTGRE